MIKIVRFRKIFDFNSIKVRLKLHGPHHNIINILIFQFHKGTIKTVSANIPEELKDLVIFQFHKGTIKTSHPFR